MLAGRALQLPDRIKKGVMVFLYLATIGSARLSPAELVPMEEMRETFGNPVPLTLTLPGPLSPGYALRSVAVPAMVIVPLFVTVVSSCSR